MLMLDRRKPLRAGPAVGSAALKTWIMPLALGIVLAGPVATYATERPYGPAHSHRSVHHQAVVQYSAPLATPAVRLRADVFSAARAEAHPVGRPKRPAFGDNETDGLSRNIDDCATYGCVGVGGG